MILTKNQLYEFEMGLIPTAIEQSNIPVEILGYGEISTVFQIQGDDQNAYKRLPLFDKKQIAVDYAKIYHSYCNYLKQIGLNLPNDKTMIITQENRPVVLYIIQKKHNPERFAHKLTKSFNNQQFALLLDKICTEIEKVWQFNSENIPKKELAIDGQLSNWILTEDNNIYYIDTSTPLFKLDEVEQLNPDLILKTAPSFLRWILKLFFLKDVMGRYYDNRQVYMDLIANLYKEQRADLIPTAIETINKYLKDDDKSIELKEVEKYYKEDKLIWTLFLAFRRFDRWLTIKIFRRRYEFILPGKIRR
ncbi:MAG: hypothetical protein GWP19_09980 [Planctomycetia bacterium]|nr:hypothetical protein [Planctomycetia bacterium]